MASDEKRPGLLSRLLGRTAPPPPPVRVEPHIGANQIRRFKAARPGRIVGGFGSGLINSPRAEVRQDLRGLIAHARFGAQNFDYLKSFEMMVRRHVVGPGGISLQMEAVNPDGKPDRAGNRLVESAWMRWGKRGNCTPCGRLSWWQVEKIAATMLAREGNFFLRIWTGRKYGPFAFQVQPLSVDLLDLHMVEARADGSYIDGGIEFDALGKPLAYHFFDGHPAEAHTGRGQARIRVPADKIIHVQRHNETGQYLGVPESHTSLRRFNMLHKYEESALTAAHYGAAAMVFLENEADGTPTTMGGDAENDIPDEMEAGSIVELPPGMKATGNPSSYPDANMPGFMKSLTRGGSAGLGVSYAGLSSDMEGANFSSLKDGRGEERDEWRVFQRDLYEGLHDPVFLAWLPVAMLAGQVGLPFTKAAKFTAATWHGRGWASVNPKDDATANEKNLANRLTTPSDIVADRGEDFERLVARYARDMETLKAANVPLSVALGGAPAAPGAAEPEAPGPGPFGEL